MDAASEERVAAEVRALSALLDNRELGRWTRRVEQRYRAVSEVLHDNASVSDVARRYGVARQTVHAWLRRYAQGGMA